MLLDDTRNRGSDSGPPPNNIAGGGSVNNDYEPGQNIRDSYNNSGLTDDDSYNSMNAGRSFQDDPDDGYQSSGRVVSDFQDSEYPSMNKEGMRDEEFQDQYHNSRRGGLRDQANRAYKRANAVVRNKPTKWAGEKFLGDKNAFKSDTPENREKVKEEAKKRARKYLSDKVGDKIGDEALKKGFQKGLSGGGKSLAKDGYNTAKVAAREARAAMKAAKAAKATADVAKGARAASAAAQGLKAGFSAVGVASAPETLGLGLLVSLLLNIAISLGIEDAIDMAFELKNGNLKKAKFHAEKAYMSIAMFIWLLVSIGLTFSVVGWIFGVPLLILLNLYAIIGIFFKNSGKFQGLARKWELAILIFADFVVFVIVSSFLAGLLYYICVESSVASAFGGTGVIGTIASAAGSLVDWATGTEYFSTMSDICKDIKNF